MCLFLLVWESQLVNKCWVYATFSSLQSNVFLYIRNRELLLPWESVVGIELTGLMQASVVRSSRGCGLTEWQNLKHGSPRGKGPSQQQPPPVLLATCGGEAGAVVRRGVGAQGQLGVNRAVVSMLLCVVFSLTQQIRWCDSPHPTPCLFLLQKLEMCKEDQYWCV